jgi:hypothetical protein
MRMKKHLVVVSIALALGVVTAASAQVTGGHVDLAPPPEGPTEVESPMKLTISLAPDEKHPESALDLPADHSRRFTQTSQFVMDEVRVPEVRVGKRGTGKKESVVVDVFLATTKFRKTVNLRVALVGDGGEVWKWEDPSYVLGFKASDAVFGGLGVASSATGPKGAKIEQSIPLTPEMRKSLGSNPRLEIVAATVE